MQYFRLILMGLAVVMAAMTAAACVGSSATPVPQKYRITPEARVIMEEVFNIVETDRPRGSIAVAGAFKDAKVGQDLIPGDAVKTFRDSEARVDIVIRDSARFARTTPDTIWRLGQFAVDQDTVMELDQGKIFTFDSGRQEDHRPLHIETPAGTASVRGTWMSVSYDPETGVVEVNCFRGACVLTNELGSVMLSEGQKSATTAQTIPSDAHPMGETEKQQFMELPEVAKGELTIPATQASLALAPAAPSLTPAPMPTLSPTPAPKPRQPTHWSRLRLRLRPRRRSPSLR